MTTTTLYRFLDAAGALLYIGVASNPARRFEQHARSKPWWADIAVARIEHHPTRKAALAAERSAILAEQPRFSGEPSVWVPLIGRYVHAWYPSGQHGDARCWDLQAA